ncbi:MAG: endonuclease III [Desulfobacteraceae bacterium]|nr:MAG: endonuclease III [Desulfobacteraceae bacterium]
MESLRKKSARAARIYETLDPLYTPSKTALQHKNPFQLLIATILSAQCTDKKVNEVTRVLFKKYKKPADFLNAPLAELEAVIRPTGFYHNKAKSLKGCSRGLLERFKGQVPANMEDMLKLPGVGRKTANVVLGAAFGVPGVVVDTHVKRLCQRLGLTENQDPDKIEKDIEKLLSPERWRRFSDILIYHGRAICKSQKPDHARCAACKLCPTNDL